MRQWYTLYTKPYSEYRVKGILQKRGIEVYLPEVDISQNKTHQSKPFFSCYLFMKIDIEKVQSSYWMYTPGLRYAVPRSDQPQPIPEQAIDIIKQNLNDINTQGSWLKQPFKSGDEVQITEGPFSGVLAIFEKPTSSEKRVQLLLRFLGRLNRIEVDLKIVEKASGSSTSGTDKKRGTRGRGRPIRNSKVFQDVLGKSNEG